MSREEFDRIMRAAQHEAILVWDEGMIGLEDLRVILEREVK